MGWYGKYLFGLIQEGVISILLTQLIPSGRYPIRPQAQTLVYSAINSLNKKLDNKN